MAETPSCLRNLVGITSKWPYEPNGIVALAIVQSAVVHGEEMETLGLEITYHSKQPSNASSWRLHAYEVLDERSSSHI